MTDRVFFPSALAAAVLLVAIALLPGLGALPTGPVSGGNTDYQRITVSGDQLNRFVAGGDADISLERIDGQTVLRVAVTHDVLSEAPLQGPHFVLDRDLETVFAGRELKVTIRVRAAEEYGAEEMRVNYVVSNDDESGWQILPVTRQFEDTSFTYTLPPRADDEARYDYLAIRPVVPEKQRALLISSVTFEPLGPPQGAGG